MGLDIGTSSVRGGLFDHTGKMLPESLARRKYTDEGKAEFDADSLLAEVCGVIDEVLALSAEFEGEITHVPSCAFWHSLVGVDEKGKPTTKVLTWADTRSRKYSDVLRNHFDETEVHDRTGAQFHSSFWPSKLLCLRKEYPEVWKKTASWLSLSDYLALRLFGTPTTSVSMASATGIFDQQKCTWNPRLLDYLELHESALPVIPETHTTFTLTEEFRRKWPRLQNAQWFPAIGDGAANNIGSRCTTRSRAALMIGTSGAMRVVYEGGPPQRLPPGLWCYRIDCERVIVGGALSDGGGLYEWLKRNLQIEISDEEIAAEVSRRGAASHGLTVMPFFFGERSTGYHENARGSINRLNASHDAIDILQAAMEAVVFRLAEVFDQLNDVSKIEDIVVSGGALDHSPVWTQIIADVLGRDLLVSNQPEASLHGAVLLALESIGKIKNLDKIESRFELRGFHPKCHDIYKNARFRHKKSYKALVDGIGQIKEE